MYVDFSYSGARSIWPDLESDRSNERGHPCTSCLIRGEYSASSPMATHRARHFRSGDCPDGTWRDVMPGPPLTTRDRIRGTLGLPLRALKKVDDGATDLAGPFLLSLVSAPGQD